jgi:hypothetical protein
MESYTDNALMIHRSALKNANKGKWRLVTTLIEAILPWGGAI